MSTKHYSLAREIFSEWEVDTEAAIATLNDVSISMHCWQGDDVVGFEKSSGTSGGGIQATGNHPVFFASRITSSKFARHVF